MQIICIHHILIELCVKEKKKEKGKRIRTRRKRKRRRRKSKFSQSIFSNVRRINRTLGLHFT